MSRRKKATIREILPDPKFGDMLISKFVNNLLKCGKRVTAERILYSALDMIEQRTKQNGIVVFHKAMENARPALEVKSRRVGGSTYQVPVEVRGSRQQALAIRWIIKFAKARPDKTMAESLASELIAASNLEGATIKKRDDTLKMAEANRAFAHFRW